MPNALQHETSPYLLQHADNPVAWYPWGKEALSLSRELNKPILLSIGYSACHWCHVMAHESFEDPQVASVMNAHFINIKVDREERPDLDQIYQTAHSMLSQKSGGWPLTVFLTPSQIPFFTGTYFPKNARYQLPSFADLIPRVAAYYYNHEIEIANQTQQLVQAFTSSLPKVSTQITANESTLQLAFEQLQAHFDFEYGGFGSAPKFPNPADITLLLHAAKAGNAQAELMALQMLSAMAAGGIYDQIGGGFCRYSVDERWNIPHFEKMLYDNGQLLCLYTDGWQLSKNTQEKALYEKVIKETITWLCDEMLDSCGAFHSSQDADSLDVHGHLEEGAFYVWQVSEIKALLSPAEFIVASRYYGFDRAPNFESQSWHPYLTAMPEGDDEVILSRVREILSKTRETRARPAQDNKILTSWNALVIKGLARAGRIFQRHDWVILAQHAMAFIYQKMWHQKSDGTHQLFATAKNNRVHLDAYLDDYAFLLDALIELLQAEYSSIEMQFSQEIANTLITHFQSAEGGFYFTAHHHEPLIHRAKQPYDNATPNGNGVAAVSLQRLGNILGESRYLQSAERTLQAFDNTLKRNPSACATLGHALNEYLVPPTIVILHGSTKKLQEWKHVIQQDYRPHHLFFYLDDSVKNLPQTLQRSIDKIFQKDVNAWICKGVVCSQGIDHLPSLLNQL
ncbi:MAG: thioredoxin domain-containing protein [Methylotenera sp.]|nr:thioredoxin domain-containing protein [Methylotenera sp.]